MSPVQGGGAGPGLRAGVDIGATKTLTVLRDERDRVLGEAVAPTPARRGGAAILDTAAGMVLGLLTGAGAALADLAGVGVGAAGVISDDGRVTAASGSFAGWVGTEIDLELSGRLGGVPVRSENDVNAFLLAELAALGRDRPRQALAVALGTGVGGALLVDGQLLRGFGAGAGEIGHVGDFGDEPCTCGRRGHLEAYAGDWALARRYAAATGLAWTADRIASAALAGDPLAAGLFERAGHCLGAANRPGLRAARGTPGHPGWRRAAVLGAPGTAAAGHAARAPPGVRCPGHGATVPAG
jgi:glucokinase